MIFTGKIIIFRDFMVRKRNIQERKNFDEHNLLLHIFDEHNLPYI